MKTTRAKAWASSLLVLVGIALPSCGKEELGMVPFDATKRQTPVAEVAELEIRALGVDRFTVCPPPGELGQPWFPQPRPWNAPAIADAGPPEPVDQDYITRTKNYTPTEQAIEATHRDFRSCYRRGLVHDPAQDGRVAIVLRIGSNGHVARVEEYAACEISVESISCMKAAAARLRFPPPPSGSDTVLIPAVFTSRDGVRKTSGTTNDSYTARAYLTMESARPGGPCRPQARSRSRSAPTVRSRARTSIRGPASSRPWRARRRRSRSFASLHHRAARDRSSRDSISIHVKAVVDRIVIALR
jgi:hypothetical protein